MSLKEFCGDMSVTSDNFTLSDDMWNEIKKCLAILKPIKIETDNLQNEQLTMTDFYCIWIKLKLQLAFEKNSSSLARELLESMKRRKSTLFSNKAMLSCMYLDPRVQILLPSDKKKELNST